LTVDRRPDLPFSIMKRLLPEFERQEAPERAAKPGLAVEATEDSIVVHVGTGSR
jgi:hypothetical protein